MGTAFYPEHREGPGRSALACFGCLALDKMPSLKHTDELSILRAAPLLGVFPYVVIPSEARDLLLVRRGLRRNLLLAQLLHHFRRQFVQEYQEHSVRPPESHHIDLVAALHDCIR